MDQLTPAVLATWQNFYVIVGSSAGALTGLQFVVITLVAQTRAARDMRSIHAFATPTVIQFCSALLLSAFMTAPWQSVPWLGACLVPFGLAGVAYSFRVFGHARNAAYQPDLEDRIWYVALPLIAHCVLLASAVLICLSVACAVVLVAADALILLVLGVHNAWDTVTYIAAKHAHSSSSGPTEEQS
jgi:hypothetical protein